MKQSICYLYEYEEYRQTKNVGFLKCIFKKESVTFQIHGKGLDCDKFMDLEMFLFMSNQEEYWVDRVGDVEGSQGIVNYMITIEGLDSEKMNRYDGVLLQSKNHKKYVALWKQKSVCLRYKREEEEAFDEEESDEVTMQCECEGDEEIEIDEEPCVEPIEIVVCEAEQEKECVELVGVTYEKISRHGISGLPQREWKWANNNFLLHGYSNYNHLMLIREEGRLYLGVPGIYHQKEEMAAKSFGFPRFYPIDEVAKSMVDMEWDEKEQFGYWCRSVTERRGMEQRYDRYESTR